MGRLGASVLLLGLLFAPPRAAPAQVPSFDETLPVDPRLRIGTLDNGLRYYVRANARPENRAELRLVVNAGSVLEAEDQQGLAHFVEHMAFKGTRDFPELALTRYLESIGMRFGPDLNAYTSFDETVYMLQVPTDSEAVLDTAFMILENWATGVLFEPDALERERGVVIEEWRARRGAQARLMDRQIPVLLHDSRYAERLPIGQRGILETAPVQALVRFYQDWYRPDLMAVIAVGDFDVDEIEALIRRRFQGIPPAPAGARDRPLYPVPDHDRTLVEITTDPEVTNTRIELYHKRPGESLATVGDYRRVLSSRLYNRMLNARLSELAQRPDPPFLAAQSGFGSFTRTSDMYFLAAIVRDGGVERGLDALATEAERVARHGFTETELERHAADLLRSYERAYAERERTESSSHAAEYVRHYLTGEAVPGIAYEYQLVQHLLPTIELAEVNRLAREWITEENRVILVSAPETADTDALPDETAMVGVLSAVAARDIDPYEDVVPESPLLAETPAAAPVVETTYHAEVDVTEWRLGNGVRVLVKPTDFRDDEVMLRAYGFGGLSLADQDMLVPARMATDVVISGGVGEFSRTQLQRVLAGKAVSVTPLLSEREQGVSGTASPQDVETLFQLVYLYFTAPRRDADAYGALLERMRASLANRGADPMAAFSDTLQLTLAQNHPRVQPPSVAMLNEADLDRSLAFYRDRFADATGFTFVLVGNLDVESLRPMVETYLGGLPATGREESWRDHGIRPPTGVVERAVRQGIEPRSQTQIVFTGEFTERPEDAHALRSLSDALELRLMDVLREEIGGTYGVGVSASVTRQPEPRYSLAVGFGTAPERLDELVGVVFEQVAAIQEDGPTDDELLRVREQQRRGRETNLRQNGYWVGQILAYDRDARDLAEILRYDRFIDALDGERIRDAARRWLRQDNYVRVSLFPAGDP